MQKRNVLHSPRLAELKRKKRKIFIRKILIFIFGSVVILAFFTYVSRLPSLNIDVVEVTGNNVVDSGVVKDVVGKQITGKYLWLFPKTNIFLYPKKGIQNELYNQFKRLKDITINMKNGRTLAISVTERTGKYIWCGEAPNGAEASIEECYFLDESGYIFDSAPYFSGEVYFKFYGKAAPGEYFLGARFKDLIFFKERLVGMGVKPVMLYVENANNIKIFLTKGKILPMGPEIIFKIDSNLENISENLNTALDTAPLKEEFKNKYSSLEYIDLRFENKVYYKFKQ